jgi:hypothetical protein
LVAHGQISVLPIRDRLSGDIPDQSIKQAEGQIVHGDVHSGCLERSDAACQIVGIIEWVDPEGLLVRERKPGVLQSHQGDVVDEGQIASQPFAGLL